MASDNQADAPGPGPAQGSGRGSTQGPAPRQEARPAGGGGAPRGGRPGFPTGPFLLFLGALAIFVAIIWYAYAQTRQSAAEGEVPLVQAERAPMMEEPAEPGGEPVANRDVTVLDRPADTAPTGPGGAAGRSPMNGPGDRAGGDPAIEDLLGDDRPATGGTDTDDAGDGDGDGGTGGVASPDSGDRERSAGVSLRQPGPATAPRPAPADPVRAGEAASAGTDETSTAAADRPANSESAGQSPAAGPDAGGTDAGGTDAGGTDAGTPAESERMSADSAAQMAARRDGAGGPDAAGATQGLYRIQVGSLRSEAAAREEWQRLQDKAPELLGDLTLTIETVDLADRGLHFRVQAGGMSRDSARDLCDELAARDIPCLAVRR